MLPGYGSRRGLSRTKVWSQFRANSALASVRLRDTLASHAVAKIRPSRDFLARAQNGGHNA